MQAKSVLLIAAEMSDEIDQQPWQKHKICYSGGREAGN